MKQVMKYMSELTTLVALVGLMIVITLINPNFLTTNNLLNLLLQVTANGFIAFGMTFVILTGGIDLSVGSILALSSALSAGFIASGVPVPLAILLAILMGGLFGMLNGFFISHGKLAPFIVTLATMTIFRGATLVYTNGNPITKGLSDSFFFQFLGQGYIVGIPFPVILMFIVFLILYVLLHKTAFGKSVYALGGNEKAAYISGVKLNKVKLIIYTISGMMAAISGLIITSRLSSAQPTAGSSYEMDAIAAVVLGGTSLSGGKGRILGTLIGALIIGVLNNGLNIIGVSAFWQQVVKGIVILIAVLLDRLKVAK
ncbi:UNVERIFIED_CONTAM: ribose ABC transporter permease [Streptococcus canis]|uniref:Ribose transport system permease protein RbsC n=1 Tax=Streptococcus canis FSL Z3-227 TaxID=482234 RepID=A0AAV3FTQ3_STRCB|nr:ribose ABC transporter permease [Streptococcus canis]EIQ82327.1 ribose transport system permease protein RbsC [Streptococcus canis FSL Z3-227]MDV5988214.1 ribose ABC transporter permease [Streptococcus canis]MDV5994260.1 ribose ABC transporter permease [Streptococcus canis]MDV6001174.1 ribose ABC transporter permease [Streptococcus canis]MDV6023069.1 ribose ABC transporter permease [Streptococcus canis]